MKTLKHAFGAAVAYGRRLPAKKLRNGLFVVAAFAGLAGLIGLTDPPRSGAAASSGAPVTVINTPLPISPTGTQTVAGTVSITGTPTVHVTNMPTVGIDSLNNTIKIVHDAENPARQPFQATVSWTLDNQQNEAFIAVPANKVLVIEYVSFNLGLPTGQKFQDVRVSTGQGGNFVLHHMTPTFTGTGGITDFFTVSQQARLYADNIGFGAIACDVLRNSGTGSGFASCSVSGYLVNVP